jgi:hypothetical protein
VWRLPSPQRSDRPRPLPRSAHPLLPPPSFRMYHSLEDRPGKGLPPNSRPPGRHRKNCRHHTFRPVRVPFHGFRLAKCGPDVPAVRGRHPTGPGLLLNRLMRCDGCTVPVAGVSSSPGTRRGSPYTSSATDACRSSLKAVRMSSRTTGSASVHRWSAWHTMLTGLSKQSHNVFSGYHGNFNFKISKWGVG